MNLCRLRPCFGALIATLLASLALVPAPARAQVTAYALVPSNANNTVTPIDTATSTVFAPISTGSGSPGTFDIAFTPDGRRAYVTNSNANTVAVIDVASRTPIGSPIPVDNTPQGIAIAPDGRTAYVCAHGASKIDVIDLTTNTVSSTLPATSPALIGIPSDGRHAYVMTQTPGRVEIIDLTNHHVDNVPLAFTPASMAVAPDGQHVYFGNQSTGDVTVFNTATNTIGVSISPGAFAPGSIPVGLVVSPDSSRLYAAMSSAGAGVLAVINLTTQVAIGGTPAGSGLTGIAMTPDGGVVYLPNFTSNAVTFINTGNFATHAVTVSHPTGIETFIGPNVIVPALVPVTIAADADLTSTGFGSTFLDFNGGTLQLAADYSTTRTISLLLHGGTIDTNGWTATFSGSVINDGALEKIGRGTLVLSGSTTQAGGAIASGGTLEVDGSATPMNVLVNGGTLSGTGTLAAITGEWGTISPGSSGPGILHAASATLESDLTFVAQLNGPAAGTGYDQLAVTGTATINNATLAVHLGYTPAPGAAFTILTHATGTFTGLPEGAMFYAGLTLFRITYHGGSGSDVVLTANSAPMITGLGDQTIAENATLGPLAFSVADDFTAPSALSITATSSDTTLLPNTQLSIGGGTGAARTLQAMPVAGESGMTTITVSVSDGALTTQKTFTLTVTAAAAAQTYYLAEGATGSFFHTDLLLANPNATAAPITITFFTDKGATIVQQRTLLPTSRTTIHVDSIAGLESAAFSTTVASTSGLPLIVERTMWWDDSGYGASGEKASDGPATSWYFAEGSQGFFATYFLLLNPATTQNTAHVTYFREGATAVQRDYVLAPSSRLTIDAGSDSALVNQSFGALVMFDQPGMAERSMYFGTNPLFNGGTAAAGATAPSKTWFLAEGATGSYFSTFVLMANPGDTDAHVTLTYLPDTGVPIAKQHTIAAHQRLTVNIAGEDPALASAAVSTSIASDAPIVVERSQYWPNPAPSWYEAHGNGGETTTATKWGLAEGRVGGTQSAQTYILIANPGTTAAAVTATFLRTDGTTIVKTFNVQPTSRFNIAVTGAGSDVPELADESFGAIIDSTQPVIVERALYWNANGVVWAAGTGASGTRLP